MPEALPPSQWNPFPGLRPFHTDEDHIFFGREDHVDSMIEILAKQQFLSVVGISGSGKSSLVNCGLEPALHQGLMASAGSNWRVARFRPEDRPIQNLARALANDDVLFSNFKDNGLSLLELIESTLRLSTVGLLDIVEQASRNDEFSLLVVVDQFEELFRYRQRDAVLERNGTTFSEEATAFVSLLLKVLEARQEQIHIVLTMRSDFLGDCTQFPGLAEVINRSLYLVPRLTREERRAAIIKPILIAGATISPILVTRLVNDVGDNPDQLSILQHALNRTWSYWQDNGGYGPLNVSHYEAIGTMAEALDRHAEEAYAELADPNTTETESRRQEICRYVFQAITDKASDGRGIRRPTKWRQLLDITKASEHELRQVVEAFRRQSRAFLMPPAGSPLVEDSVIDISHESLMRVWRRLSSWGEQEARWAEEYRRLAETAHRKLQGNESLLRDPALQGALNWWNERQPNPAWGSLYHPGFQDAKELLEESSDARSKEQEAEQRELDANKRRQRRTLIGSLLIAIAAIASAGWMWHQYDEAKRQVARTWAAVAVGLTKEHIVEPETSIKLTLAALNRPLGNDQSEAIKMIINLFNAIDLHGERASSYLKETMTRTPIYSLAAIDKGDQLVSAGPNGTFQVWSSNLGEPVEIIDDNLADPLFLRLSSGNIVVAGVLAGKSGESIDDRDKYPRLQLWSRDMKKKLTEIKPKPSLNGFRFLQQSPVNGHLVIADEWSISLWKTSFSQIRRVPIRGLRKVTILKPSGHILISMITDEKIAKNKLQLWSADLTTILNEVSVGDTTQDTIHSLLQLSDERIVSGTFKGFLQLWSKDLKPVGPLINAHSRQILSLEELDLAQLDKSRSELITGSADGTLRRWLISKDGLSALHLPFPTDQGAIQTLLAVNSALFSGGSNGSLKRWQWERSIFNRMPNRSGINDYEAVMVSPHRGGEIYRLKSGKTDSEKILEFGPADGGTKKLTISRLVSTSLIPYVFSMLALSPVSGSQAQELVTGHMDGSVRKWRFQGGGNDKKWIQIGMPYRLTSLPQKNGQKNHNSLSVMAIAELPNRDLVLGMKDGFIQMVRINGNELSQSMHAKGLCRPRPEQTQPLGMFKKDIFSLAVLPNGDLVSGSKNGTILRWKNPLQEWCRPPTIIPGVDESEVFSMVALDEASMLTSTGSGGLTLWKWKNHLNDRGETDSIYWKQSSIISSVAYVPERRALIAADFQGNYKYYPGKKQAITLGCRALRGQLEYNSINQPLKPFELEAAKACGK
jgi:WD40 repeat protein